MYKKLKPNILKYTLYKNFYRLVPKTLAKLAHLGASGHRLRQLAKDGGDSSDDEDKSAHLGNERKDLWEPFDFNKAMWERKVMEMYVITNSSKRVEAPVEDDVTFMVPWEAREPRR